jgi:hypothetical protein
VTRELSVTVNNGGSQATTVTRTTTRNHASGEPAKLHAFYYLTDEHDLRDRYGNTVTRWEYVDQNAMAELTYTQ